MKIFVILFSIQIFEVKQLYNLFTLKMSMSLIKVGSNNNAHNYYKSR